MNKKQQEISQAKGRPMLHWVGKKPLSKVEYYPAQEKEVYGNKDAKWFNKLFWGDNLQVLSHLLKEFRGKIDLIYIDPPFDSKADYVKKVKIKGQKIDGQQQSLIEEKQYTDMWDKDEYLQFMFERLQIMRELLSETGSIYLHCDWHRGAFLKLVMDEVFGEDNFRNEIIWHYQAGTAPQNGFAKKHDNILFYSKSKNNKFNPVRLLVKDESIYPYKDEDGRKYRMSGNNNETRYYADEGRKADDVWTWLDRKENNIVQVFHALPEHLNYPTQKPEALLERIIKASSNEGDIIFDCFAGSGTTSAVAQRLNRKWIACDINIGAIQTTIKRLNTVLEKNKGTSKDAFKVFNVNDYDVFKNELEAKGIVMDLYGIEPIKRTYFDGLLDNNYVKVMPMNRVLNKLDIKNVLKNVSDKISDFTPKKTSKKGEEIFEEGVLVVCSGMELDVIDYLKKENNTGVKIEVRDILTDKQNLVFKQKPEAKIEAKQKDGKLSISIKEFYSPILIRKLEIENEKVLKKKEKAKVEDFKQIIDSIAIDVDYDGKLFNAEIIDVPSKKDVVEGEYAYEYKKKGNYEVAVKIVDVLGEEYFEVIKV